VCSLVF